MKTKKANQGFQCFHFYKKLKMKKGSVTGSKLLDIILLVVSLVLLTAGIYFVFGSGTDIDREVCYDSVVLRGTFPDNFGLKNLPELNCKTRYVCLTNKMFGRGNCDSYGDNVEVVRISSTNTDKEINQFFARELATCWAMMNEGNSQIFTRESSQTKKCSICSVIYFEEDLKERQSVTGLADYLVNYNVPQKQVSYANFLNLGKDDLKGLLGITTDPKAIVYFEIGKGKIWGDIFGFTESTLAGGIGFKVGAVAGSVFGPIGTGVGAIIGTTAGAVFGWVDSRNVESAIIGDKKYSSGWALINYNEREIGSLECKSY